MAMPTPVVVSTASTADAMRLDVRLISCRPSSPPSAAGEPAQRPGPIAIDGASDDRVARTAWAASVTAAARQTQAVGICCVWQRKRLLSVHSNTRVNGPILRGPHVRMRTVSLKQACAGHLPGPLARRRRPPDRGMDMSRRRSVRVQISEDGQRLALAFVGSEGCPAGRSRSRARQERPAARRARHCGTIPLALPTSFQHGPGKDLRRPGTGPLALLIESPPGGRST